MRVAINGFGRIGRMVLRAALENNVDDIEFVAINDLADADTNAHLLQFDSTHSRAPFEVKNNGDCLEVKSQKVKCISVREPAKLPWKDMAVDLVLECTGLFTACEKAAGHLSAGAKKVLISGPSSDADKTVVFGVNDKMLTPEHLVISNASCTTNCLAPVALILDRLCGIEYGNMTTVHSYTSDQSLLDVSHSDKHRARAAGLSMIPTSTGAAKAIALVMPKLAGKIAGTAIRVPTPNVSLIDLVVLVEKPISIDKLNDAFVSASKGELKNILSVNNLPLVSSDFNHNSASSVVDLTQTNVIKDKMVRILSWYDNEWGFANRMVDVAKKIGSLMS